ncbi:hypothetical protein ACIQZO_39375 [Streptomyces sp. NPDC097617]|uniref:hypothetical protein n=1 Tax=Streptomyces sp. NPDC097617 TaxID=3366091 RepID=UPI00380516FA
MADIVPYGVAIRGAAEVLVKAAVLRDFLPSRLAAERAHSPGGRSVEELETLIIQLREGSIAARICMAQADHGFFAGARGVSVAGSVDRASEQILRERALDHASKPAAKNLGTRAARKVAAWNQLDEPLPELAFMTIRQVARAVSSESFGRTSLAETEEMIRIEHAARMAEYRGRPPQVCVVTGRECHPVTRDAQCRSRP